MPSKQISDLFHIRNRFLRSAHLERDFVDPSALSSYVVTDFTRTCLKRMAGGLKSRSGQRAWRMTGDYGSGKSSFALLLAHCFAGQTKTLPSNLRQLLELEGVGRQKFLPVLVTCNRQPLGVSILRSLHGAVSQIYDRGIRSKVAIEVQRLIDSPNGPSEDHVFELILEINSRLISDSKAKGVLLILDELGKFLEFASLHPERQDVFLLQRLAEAASRSGDKPLFVVCLLHQGFNAYASHLNQVAQREWEKVAGRFEEILFNQPIEQIAHLIAAALNVATAEIPRTDHQEIKEAIANIVRLGWYGAADPKRLSDVALRLYPLHPTVLPVLIRAFRRFGQNERSLFSFLLSNEPFGLQAFSRATLGQVDCYRLHNLYDYVRTNFGHRLSAQSYRSHWSLIESVVDSFATEDEEQIRVLKTVGILNLLNDTDLLPTEESLICALSGSNKAAQSKIRSTVAALQESKRVLYSRGHARGFCLWPYTSVDLEKAYEDACRVTDTPQHVAGLIKEYLSTRPVVARRHYIETGNLRHFEVRYVVVGELTTVEPDSTKHDGVIIVPLCETAVERKEALAFAQHPDIRQRQNCLVAVPMPLNNLAGLVQEVQRWDWISSNVPELNADRYACEELSRQKAGAQLALEKRIRDFIGWNQFNGETSLAWFHQGRALEIPNGRQLLKNLSQICDRTFPDAPIILNELVNRRSLSSAAAAARMRLIERMFSHGTEPWLGMDEHKKPPEMSMYLSVLKRANLHRALDDHWQIVEPHGNGDRCNVLPTLRRIREIVQSKNVRVNVGALFDELRRPPYGVRDGLLPILLSVFAIAHERDVAFYKDGTFLREFDGGVVLLLTKDPARFDIQYCKIDGVRAELFERLLTVLDVKTSQGRQAELLDVVKTLCVFVAQLPAYVLNTKRLPESAISVRNEILNAREPSTLLFVDLPKACAFQSLLGDSPPSKHVKAFVQTLKMRLDELRFAFPALQDRIREQLKQSFGLPSTTGELRTALAGRAKQIMVMVTEPKLRSFCARLCDSALSETDWIESIGSHLALKPPSRWHDAEEEMFNSELAQFAVRFERVESIAFGNGKPSEDAIGVRFSVTYSDGAEHEQVVHFSADELSLVEELEAEFGALLTKDKRLGLAALSRAVWTTVKGTNGP
jgi:hypothetical protein